MYALCNDLFGNNAALFASIQRMGQHAPVCRAIKVAVCQLGTHAGSSTLYSTVRCLSCVLPVLSIPPIFFHSLYHLFCGTFAVGFPLLWLYRWVMDSSSILQLYLSAQLWMSRPLVRPTEYTFHPSFITFLSEHKANTNNNSFVCWFWLTSFLSSSFSFCM